MEWYWLIYNGTGSVWGNTWSYLVVLDQYRAVLVGTWRYWVSKRRYYVSIRQKGQKLFGGQVEKV